MITLTVWSDLTSYLALGVIAVVIVLSLFAAPKDYLPVPPERKRTKQRNGDPLMGYGGSRTLDELIDEEMASQWRAANQALVQMWDGETQGESKNV